MHVALIRRLAVHHPRPVIRLCGFGLEHRQSDVAKFHAAPVLGHVRHPQSLGVREPAKADDLVDIGRLIGCLQLLDLGLGRKDHIGDERSHPGTELFDVGWESKVDGHRRIVAVADR